MEPITLLITLAPLLISYAKEKKEQSQYSLEDFQEWMEFNHQNEILKSIEKNQNLLGCLKAILNENQSILITKIENLEDQITSTLANNMLSRDMAISIDPHIGLSNQAINILKQINTVQASKILELNYLGVIEFMFLDGTGNGNLEITDRRFLEDDISKLVDMGYLNVEYNSQNKMVLHITRLGGGVI